MKIPEELQAAIEESLLLIKGKCLEAQSASLSHVYREKQGRYSLSYEEKLAYLAARLPATFAVLVRVLQEVRRLIPDIHVDTILDLGSGPGTALWAYQQVFTEWTHFYLLEKDPEWIELGKKLVLNTSWSPVEWIEADMRRSSFPKSFLWICSYAIGEMEERFSCSLAEQWWKQKESELFLLVEPGTPKNTALLQLLRKKFVSLGATIVAPCPHQQECPLAWCHFSVRLERTSLHQRAKKAKMGFEDEKFCYLLVSKKPQRIRGCRILHQPLVRSGHVVLSLCCQEGLKEQIVSRKEKELYLRAKKLQWGDLFVSDSEGT